MVIPQSAEARQPFHVLWLPVDQSGCPVAWDNEELLMGNQRGNIGCPVGNYTFVYEDE